MLVERHIEYFTEALRKVNNTSDYGGSEIRVHHNWGSFIIGHGLVRVDTNSTAKFSVLDDSLHGDSELNVEPAPLNAGSLVDNLKGIKFQTYTLTETDEDYFQKSTLSSYVYPPEVTKIISQIAERIMDGLDD